MLSDFRRLISHSALVHVRSNMSTHNLDTESETSTYIPLHSGAPVGILWFLPFRHQCGRATSLEASVLAKLCRTSVAAARSLPPIGILAVREHVHAVQQHT